MARGEEEAGSLEGKTEDVEMATTSGNILSYAFLAKQQPSSDRSKSWLAELALRQTSCELLHTLKSAAVLPCLCAVEVNFL